MSNGRVSPSVRERRGLQLAGFTDQHHFLTGLLSSYPGLASAGAEKSRALQTLIHPEFLGTKFQFLALTKGFPAAESLGGFKFARDSRRALGLELGGTKVSFRLPDKRRAFALDVLGRAARAAR